jgi:hypothetical protein
MTDAAMKGDRAGRTLVVGGVLLIASAVLAFVSPSVLSMPAALSAVVYWSSTIAFSAALLVYAFGLGRSGSIVARRPLGVGAMVLLAVWPLIDRVVTLVVPFTESTTEFHLTWGWVAIALRLAAAIVVVVEIARAGVLVGRVRWAPLWALVAVAGPQVIAQLYLVATGLDINRTEDDLVWLVLGLGQLTAFAAPVVLGILSVVLAQRRTSTPAADPVQVYPPAP